MIKQIFFVAFQLVSLTGLLITASRAGAAPHPGTATSTLVSPQLGLYRSPHGFQLNAGVSGWKQAEPPSESKFIATMYKSTADATSGKDKKNDAGSLTVRVDQLPKEVELEKYVQRWMKEYPKYGFDVIGSMPFSQNKDKGFVLDLINRESGRQLRQVLFVKKQRAVILTCRDKEANFKDSLKSCNQIIKTFQWL